MVTHDIKEWFGSNADLMTYFTTEFKLGTLGNFKAPASALQRVNDTTKLIGQLGNIIVLALLASPKSKKLKQIKWSLLESDTQHYLKEAVCEGIQHMVENNNVWEKVKSSSVTTTNFTLNSDSTNWLLTADMFGQIARTAIEASGINEYEWIVDEVLFASTQNGNVKIIGKEDVQNDTFWKVA